MEKKVKRVVIIGPESTGKSTLSAQLAEYYKTNWVTEYAREYLQKNGAFYVYENLYDIAQGQMLAEAGGHAEAVINVNETNNPLLIIDTNLYVIKVWSEFVFNKCDNRILSEIAQREYDLYLLCNLDLPWIKDELREYPDINTRNKLFQYYKAELTAQNVPWVIIKGNNEERLNNAINAVNTIL